MVSDRNKAWTSQLAQELLRTEGGSTVEEAALRLVDRNLNMLNPYKPPVDLSLVASIMSIQPNFNYVDMEQSARIVERDGKYSIDVNQNHSKQRQRFSIGHEIAHKMLAGKKLQGVKSRDNHIVTKEKNEEEALCDLIAGYLLGLRPDILTPILLHRDFSFDTIQYVTTRFDVSFEATARALIRFFDGVAAVLYCRVSNLLNSEQAPVFNLYRYYATTSFPGNFQLGQPIPPLLCLKRAYLSDSLIKLVEVCNFNRTATDEYNCQAKKLTIYPNDIAETGVVLILCPYS